MRREESATALGVALGKDRSLFREVGVVRERS
jgi:hypothetical protein